MEAILDFVNSSGFVLFTQGDNWKCLIMLVIACGLLYLGIVKKFEPLLLVPIAFGMLITNLPGAEMYHEIFFAGGHIHWDLIGGAEVTQEFINGLHVRFILWAGDEEFPPSSQILFEDNFPYAYQAEDLAVVGDISITTLKSLAAS